MDRCIEDHIMTVLTEQKGFGLRFRDIRRWMLKKGWDHYQGGISDNLKKLLNQNKIVKVERFYGIPLERSDGSKYLTITDPIFDDRIVEIE